MKKLEVVILGIMIKLNILVFGMAFNILDTANAIPHMVFGMNGFDSILERMAYDYNENFIPIINMYSETFEEVFEEDEEL